MRYQDVQMVNSSLERLGEALLRQKMLDQQEADRADTRRFRDTQAATQAGQFQQTLAQRQDETRAAREDRRTQFGFEERRTKASEDQARDLAALKKLMLENTQAQQAISNLRNHRNDIARMHEAGQISTAEANRQTAALRDKMTEGNKVIWQEAGLDVEFQDKPQKQVTGSSAVATDRYAAQLEAEAGTETDPVKKQMLLERAAELRRTLGPSPAPEPRDVTVEDVLPGGAKATRRLTAKEWEQQREEQELKAEYAALLEQFQNGDKSGSARMIEIKRRLAAPAPPIAATPGSTASDPDANGAPKVGEVRRGYRYLGGDPAQPRSWQKL